MSIFSKGRSMGAFSNALICPICHQNDDYDSRKQIWKLDRWISNHLARYICKKCKTPIRYEISRYSKTDKELAELGLKN